MVEFATLYIANRGTDLQGDSGPIFDFGDGLVNKPCAVRWCGHYLISPEPGILGRLSVDSSAGSRKPAHEQSNSDETTRKIAAENAVASLMHTIRGGNCFGCGQLSNDCRSSPLAKTGTDLIGSAASGPVRQRIRIPGASIPEEV